MIKRPVSAFNLKIAINGLLIILACFIVFHILILTGAVPYEMVWGGRLQQHSDMLLFETISIVLNLLMILVIAIHSKMLKWHVHTLIMKTALWLMVVLFLLNTVGNLLSKNEWEKLVFTPLTAILFIFSLILARGSMKTHEAVL
jgi:hypothetical protein